MTDPYQDPELDSAAAQQSSQIENPISFHGESNQQNDPQSPQTLETSKNQDLETSDPNLEETQVVVDQEEESSGMVTSLCHSSAPTKLTNRRNVNKRKKAGEYMKQLAINKKVQNLLELGTFVSFMPSKTLDFGKHEVLFKRLGLWEFVHIEFDESIRADLIGQIIASYSKKCCYVNGCRISINRTNFARALKLPLPPKKDKAVGSAAEAAIDLDLVWEKASEECVLFVEDFVQNWVLLHGGDWVMPNEIQNWMGFIKVGHPEKVDWASLFWVMVENELKQKDLLRTCYYTSHLQYFIKSQRKELFEEDGETVVANDKMKGKWISLSGEDKKQVEVEEIKKDDLLLEEPQKVDEKEVMNDRDLLMVRPHEAELEEVKKGPCEVVVEEVKEWPHEEVVEVKEVKEGSHEVVVKVEGVKKDADGSFYDSSKEQNNVVLEEPNIELTLGQQDIVKKEEIKNDNMMAVEESTEIKDEFQCLDGNEKGSKHFLQPCIFREGRGSDGNEEREQEDEQLEMEEEEEHIQEWEHMEEGEQMEEVEGDEMAEQLEVEDEEDEEEELEDGIECNTAPNYGSLEGADLTGDLLQGFETAQLPLNLQGQQLHENSSMELFASNAETHVMMDGHKRVIDYEPETSHLNQSKRIRTDGGWDQKTSDFGFCMRQVEQFMEKAKIIYEEKEQDFNQVNMNQQYLLRDLQQRDNIIENLQRSKNEELQKKDREIFRLERELGLLGELVNGYREALKENRRVFLEYRQRCELPEEPIYKDAGPGGLVLSITELEKQRQQQENEDRLKRFMIEHKFNEALEGYVNQFDVLFGKVQMIDINRLTPIENEVKLLKESYAEKRRASEKADCVPTETVLPSA